MKKDLLIEIICGLLILLFSYAAISKLIDYSRFSIQLAKAPFIHNWSALLVWAIPLSELFMIVLLMFRKTRKAALYSSVILLSTFTVYIVSVLTTGVKRPCSCGGVLSQLSWEEHIVFNLFFLSIAIVGIIVLQSKSTTINFQNILRNNRESRKPA